ncbi:MAG: RNA 2',3'-cyclic phosphodiesterase [Euryarchaeota archaeon]|nr:RNA 2',3'-cyclic phosphodiesterase [Euryarchaeota archaeon]
MPFRAFVSVDVESNEKIVRFAEELRRAGRTLKVVDPSIIHLTLKFLGETEERIVPEIRQVIERSTAGIHPMRLRLVGAGTFPGGSRIRVVWIGVEGAGELGVIARRLDEELQIFGFRREGRPFAAHITLARAREPIGMGAVKNTVQKYSKEDFGEQMIRSVRLKRSVLTPSGPAYSTVEEVALEGR